MQDEGPSSKKAKDGEISMESEETLTSLVRKRIPFYSYGNFVIFIY